MEALVAHLSALPSSSKHRQRNTVDTVVPTVSKCQWRRFLTAVLILAVVATSLLGSASQVSAHPPDGRITVCSAEQCLHSAKLAPTDSLHAPTLKGDEFEVAVAEEGGSGSLSTGRKAGGEQQEYLIIKEPTK
jgi:hypothetical protein